MTITTTATTTTRCTLPLPIGAPELDLITVMITDLKDYLHGDEPLSEDDSPMPGIEIWIGQEGYYPKTRFVGKRDGSHLIDVDNSSVAFASLGIAVAHVMLGNYGAEYLGLDEKLAASWSELRFARSVRMCAAADRATTWERLTPLERSTIIEVEDAAELARAERAHTVLDIAIRELTGSGIDELLANGRPFDPEFGRYLDGAREYSDGSGGDGA